MELRNNDLRSFLTTQFKRVSRRCHCPESTSLVQIKIGLAEKGDLFDEVDKFQCCDDLSMRDLMKLMN